MRLSRCVSPVLACVLLCVAVFAQTSVSPTSLSFGSLAAGTTSGNKNVTLKNTQSLPLTNIVAMTTNDYAVAATTCGTSLNPNSSCTFSVVFQPTIVGTDNGTLTVTHSASNSPQTVPLTGTGVAPVALTPSSLTSSATQVGGASTAQSVTLKNNQNVVLTGITIATSGDFTQTNNCASTLNGGASCKINVAFRPQAGGTRTGALTISDSALGSPQVVPLSGTGSGATVSVAPGSWTFAGQLQGTVSAAQVVTVTNTGAVAIAMAGISLSGEFVQSNNCPASLAVSARCVISLQFAPQSVGAKSGVLSISDNATGSPQQLALSGTGTSKTLSVAPATLSWGTQMQGTTSSAQAATVTATGTLPVTISGITVSGEFAQNSTCGGSLNPGASCTISVTFAPVSAGSKTGSLTISDDATGAPHVVSLSGTGTARILSVTPSSLNLGDVLMGTASAAQTVTVSNTGTADVSISLVGVNGAFQANNACPATLMVGQNCTISVTFSPTATGTATAALTIGDNANGAPHSVALNGNGTSRVLTVSQSNLAFGNQVLGTTSASQTVTLNNTGTLDVTLGGISISGDFQQSGNCGSTLARGASCTVQVAFTPQTAGVASGALTINDNATGTPHSVTLTGNGLTRMISVTPVTLAFDDMLIGTTSAAQTVTINNTGTAEVAIDSVIASGAFSSSNGCPATLAAGQNCAVSVTFAPQTTGSLSGTLTITDNASGAPHSAALSGNGTSRVLSLSQAALSFGDQVVGTTSAVQTVTLSNTGTLAVTLSRTSLTGDFQQSSSCGASLAAGNSCAVQVTFAPHGAGAATGVLTINDDATGAPHYVALSGLGIPVALQSIAVSPQISRALLGRSQSFTATGVYNDGHSEDLTASAVWSSSNPSLSSMSGATATAVAMGTVTISAQSGPVTGTATFTATTADTINVGSMLHPRYWHAAVPLADGRILVVGGGGDNGPVLEAEIYDPATKLFTATGTLNSAHSTAVRLQDGRVLVLGSSNTAEIYDPSTGQFSSAGTLSTARGTPTVTLLNDGRVLITGGDSVGYGATSSAEIYDPQTGTFSSTSPMLGVRREHTATLLPDGRVLIVGGDDSSRVGTAEIFDPTTNTFTATGSMPVTRYSHTATLLPDGTVLIAAGYGTELLAVDAYLYDPVTGTFSPAGSLFTSRYNATATLLDDGRVMVAGGLAWYFSTASVEIWEPATRTFSVSRELNSRRFMGTATKMQNGGTLFIGGSNMTETTSGFAAEAELYAGSVALTGIQVTPAEATLAATGVVNRWMSFRLTGTFADGSQQLLSVIANWTPDPAIVYVSTYSGSVNGSGVVGTTTINAQFGAFNSSAVLHVQ